MRQWRLGGSGIVVTAKTAPREAGRLGGQAIVKAIGNEGMKELAQRGGAATLAAKGKEHLAELGRRGQRARAANMRRAILKEVEARALESTGDAELLQWLRTEIAACGQK